jgi:predicted nucleotidyltransferase component of viral defense system
LSPDKKKNPGHSVFQRLLNYARNSGEDFNLLLSRYGIERLLYRLSISSHADKFILKGASLFLVWKGQNYRVTRDADLLGSIPSDPDQISDIFRELCQSMAEDVDGLEFMADSVRAVPIREEQSYDGIRVTLMGKLHQAQIPLRVDIGFGDAVTPEPETVEFPTLLDAPPPKLMAYTRYTMIAEKVETLVRLGVANSRMKDFYDLWLMSRLFEFEGSSLCNALRNTFKRRSTPLPQGLPMAFTNEFSKDERKQSQWKAFVRKSKPKDVSGDLDNIVGVLRVFLMPVLEAACGDDKYNFSWAKGGPWD